MGYRSATTVYVTNYPIIWRPKYRRRMFVGQVEARLKRINAEVVRGFVESRKRAA